MNQRILSSLTATLITTVLSTATATYAQQTQTATQGSTVSSPTVQVPGASATSTLTLAQPTAQATEVVKVGEVQSRIAAREEEVIAKIHAHEVAGRQAATLFVRSIPVLTFLGSNSVATNGTKVGESDSLQKTASEDTVPRLGVANATGQISAAPNLSATGDDPVWRATAIAAKLNQLSRDNVNADTIAVQLKPECNCYSIDVNDEELVRINETTILPDTTHNPAEDALQATNRLRRLMGNAPPLREIAGMQPATPLAQVSLGPIRVQVSGIASWYGPGFHGKRSASGERYNQNAMTAAHRSLPFGTHVQVTNLNNGRSVVVRINDRGPYIRGRVIDLSAAAARMLGLIHSGTAPVRIDVFDPSQPAVVEY